MFLAATQIGATWLGLNPGYKRDELRYIVSDCQPKMIFSISHWEGRDYAEDILALKEEFPCIEKLVAIEGAIPDAVPLLDFNDRAGEVSADQYRAAVQATGLQDPILLVYTSGTSGQPKGALLSNFGLTRGAVMQTRHFGVEDPQLVANFPINHVACVADTCATTVVKGGKIIFQQRFDPVAMLQTVQDEKCTLMGGVPTMLQMLLDQPGFESYDLSSLECVLWGAQPCLKTVYPG